MSKQPSLLLLNSILSLCFGHVPQDDTARKPVGEPRYFLGRPPIGDRGSYGTFATRNGYVMVPGASRFGAAAASVATVFLKCCPFLMIQIIGR
jgi:hypothetical protein